MASVWAVACLKGGCMKHSILSRILAYLVGLTIFCIGLFLVKKGLFLPALVFVACGMIITAIVQITPEKSKAKYKLKEKHIDELVAACGKDSLIRELAFLKNERTEELVEYVEGLSFEDALIVIKSIETKYPNITIGRGIEL